MSSIRIQGNEILFNLSRNQKSNLSHIAQKAKLFHFFNKVKLKQLQENSESREGKNIGIITTGINYSYVIQACSILKISPPILKLGLIFPINQKEICKFANRHEIEILLIVEELNSLIEDFLREIFDKFCITRRNIEIYGKSFIPNTLEIDTLQMIKLFSQYFLVKNKDLFEDISRKEKALKELIPTLLNRG